MQGDSSDEEAGDKATHMQAAPAAPAVTEPPSKRQRLTKQETEATGSSSSDLSLREAPSSAKQSRMKKVFSTMCDILSFKILRDAYARATLTADDQAIRNMTSMKHVIFVNLDNWSHFFHGLPHFLPEKTFVWLFYGARNNWIEPEGNAIYADAKERKIIYMNRRSGTTADAADYAICLKVGHAHTALPKKIRFSIVSSDPGFEGFVQQFQNDRRRLALIDPHVLDGNELYDLLAAMTID